MALQDTHVLVDMWDARNFHSARFGIASYCFSCPMLRAQCDESCTKTADKNQVWVRKETAVLIRFWKADK